MPFSHPRARFGSEAGSIPVSSVVHTQCGGTCYANAIATAVRAAESRIVGREPASHAAIVGSIVRRHGTDGGHVASVLTEECIPRQLRWTQLTDASACRQVVQQERRVAIASFWLSGRQWERFSQFFRQNPRGVLRGAEVGQEDEEDELDMLAELQGHAVGVVGFGRDYVLLKNSWGAGWGQDGCFKVELGAVEFKFYDVFYVVQDLTAEDRSRFALAQRQVR